MSLNTDSGGRLSLPTFLKEKFIILRIIAKNFSIKAVHIEISVPPNTVILRKAELTHTHTVILRKAELTHTHTVILRKAKLTKNLKLLTFRSV